jgi:hypothetical protein
VQHFWGLFEATLSPSTEPALWHGLFAGLEADGLIRVRTRKPDPWPVELTDAGRRALAEGGSS